MTVLQEMLSLAQCSLMSSASGQPACTFSFLKALLKCLSLNTKYLNINYDGKCLTNDLSWTVHVANTYQGMNWIWKTPYQNQWWCHKNAGKIIHSVIKWKTFTTRNCNDPCEKQFILNSTLSFLFFNQTLLNEVYISYLYLCELYICYNYLW